MAESVFRGPAYSAGAMLDGRVEPTDGPGLEYQANGFPDIRVVPTRKDGLYPGRVPSFLNSPFVVVCDNIPQAAATNSLSLAVAPVAATPVTLIAAQANGTTAGNPTSMPGATIIRADTGAAVSGVTVLDAGFATGTTALSKSLPVNDGTLFFLGQWIAIGGAANAGKTLPLYTQVQGISGNTLTLRDAPAVIITNAPIANAQPPSPIGPPNVVATALFPYLIGGLGAFLNPPEALARNVSITGNASSLANNVTVRGYDIFGYPMTEVIAFAGNATTKFGLKAFKAIASVTPATSDPGHTLAVGWGDTFGFHTRSDKWEYTNIFYNGGFAVSSTGWLTSDKTNPATGSTGDVRGTVQVSTNGNGSALAAPLAAVTNGTTIRLTMAMTVPLYNNIFGNPVNSVPMYGQAQFAG
jgi:hypothetical protein